MEFRCRRRLIALAISASVGAGAALTRAGVTETDASAASETTYDANIQGADLIENSSAALSGVPVITGAISTYAGAVAPYNSWSNLTDGLASTKATNGANDLSRDTYFDTGAYATNPTITYSFNTAANPNGFTLNSINAVCGWADTTSFSNQSWSVSASLVNSPNTFTPLATVNYAPFSGNGATANSSQVTLAGSSGALATNVAALRFSIQNNGGSGQVFREIDVSGLASTNSAGAPQPTPTSLGVIMPLGDSITYGDQGNPAPIPGGYRTQLYTHLANDNYAFTLSGSQTGNASTTLSNANQANNEGHDGYRIDQVLNNLDGSDGTGGNNGGYWLTGGNGTGRPALNPNYILLHIGTNDILQHYDPSYSGTAPETTFISDLESRMTSLVTKLTGDRPNADLMISSIIPIPNHTNANGVDENTEVKTYDTWIQDTLIPDFQQLGDHVFYVDQYDNFVNPDGSINTALLPDNIHPNQQGYNMMGDTWAESIEATVPEPSAGFMLLFGAVPLAIRRRRGAARG